MCYKVAKITFSDKNVKTFELYDIVGENFLTMFDIFQTKALKHKFSIRITNG